MHCALCAAGLKGANSCRPAFNTTVILLGGATVPEATVPYLTYVCSSLNMNAGSSSLVIKQSINSKKSVDNKKSINSRSDLVTGG
jgi:hypothetical protein